MPATIESEVFGTTKDGQQVKRYSFPSCRIHILSLILSQCIIIYEVSALCKNVVPVIFSPSFHMHTLQ